MDCVQTKNNEKILILPDCCPNTKYLYYRPGVLEMPLNCSTPCNNIVYKFKPLKANHENVIVHPMYGHLNIEHDTYYGPINDTFLYYIQLLKDVAVIEGDEKSDVLHFPHLFDKQRFLNKRYSKIDSFDGSNVLNILVLHNAFFQLASQLRQILRSMGFKTFIIYMTDVTLAKLGNINGDYIIFGCFNKTLHLLYSEISKYLNLYTAWDIVYWLNKDSEINFCSKYYLNPLDIPVEYLHVTIEQKSHSTEIIKASSRYGSYTGLPVTSGKPISKIQRGKSGIASDYHEI
eukprot:NODE_276_length_12087_cov_0.626376.p4 type:complete len:289 gc:universal NODE_276_length_12087_cov_0.626376:3494-4360(+)